VGVTDQTRLRSWERRTGPALTTLGVLFLMAYATPILKPDLPPEGHAAADAVEIITWLALVVDLVVRIRLTGSTGRFLRTHLFDIVVLALPMVRPLRALRIIAITVAMHRRVTTFTRLRLSTYVAGTTVLLVFVASLAVLDAERGRPGANIGTYFDALWWTMTTVSTVGYGDRYPVTVEGRIIAIALMLGGIGLLAFVTGSLATWLIEYFKRADTVEEETREDVADLLTEVRALRVEVRALRTDASGQTPSRG
jgi:voltage-gated potassium channel